MPRRKWDAKTKALIVLEGFTGKAVAEICTEPQLSPSQYDPWRDQFLANAAQTFAVHQHTRREAHLEHEHRRLKKLVGELTLPASPEGGTSLVGLPPSLGVPALCGAPAHQQTADLAPEWGTSAPGPAESAVESPAPPDPSHAQAHAAACMVGDRHDRGAGGGCRLGRHRDRA